MRRVRVIPVLLLDTRKIVKTIQFKNPSYIGDPINTLRIFNDKEVDEICILDISVKTNGGSPDLDYIKLLASECFMPLSYGGGVATTEMAMKIFRAGVEKIVFGEAAFKNSNIVTKVAVKAGSQSVVISIDVKKDWLGRQRVFVSNGKDNTGLSPVEYARRMEEAGAGELLVQCIDFEGLQEGYCIDCIREVSQNVSIPVIASGGAGRIEDFLNAVRAGAAAVAAGSFFVYKGTRKGVLISYPDQKSLTEKLYTKV
jgi:cyclase